MPHMVICHGADGKPDYHQVDELHEAIGLVERLRNEQGVEHARIFRLEEVPFQFRPYFRVEVDDRPQLGAGSAPAAAPAPPDAVAGGGEPAGPAAAVGEQVAAGGGPEERNPGARRGLFGR